MESFTKRLNIAMTKRNMKPIDLVNKTGLSKARISQYVNGVYQAKQDALLKLATALDVNIAWLMGHDVPMEYDYEKLQKDIELCELIQKIYGKDTIDLINLYQSLNDNGKKVAITVLQGLLNNSEYKK